MCRPWPWSSAKSDLAVHRLESLLLLHGHATSFRFHDPGAVTGRRWRSPPHRPIACISVASACAFVAGVMEPELRLLASSMEYGQDAIPS